MNNIFCNYRTGPVSCIDGARDGSSILDTCNYNLYYTANNPYATHIMYQIGGKKYYFNDWAKLQSDGYELNSPKPQDPHFIDLLKDLHLKPSSPAIRHAVPVSFVKTDKDGKPRDTKHPDIGAFEY